MTQEAQDLPSSAEILDSFDAQVWAANWLKVLAANPSIPTDEGCMIGWFANALMRGYDEHARKTDTDTARLDWWFAHGMSESVCEGSVDLWWVGDEGDTERVTHGTTVRDALDKAMRGICESEPEAVVDASRR